MKHLQHKVLKQFPWSSNGYDVEILKPGDARNFGVAEAGLAAEGFISSDAKLAEPAVEAGKTDVEVEHPADEAGANTAESTTEAPAEPAVEAGKTTRKRK